MSLRNFTETAFERWSEFAVRHCWFVLLVVIGATLAVIPQLKNMWMDFSSEAYLPKHEQSVLDYDQFRFQFGYSGTGIIAIETSDSIFTLENLQKLKALQDDIEENVPHIEEITSLVSATHSSGEDSSLTIRDLVELWPETEADLPSFKKMVLDNRNYAGNLVSKDGKLTTLIIKPDNYTAEHGNDSLESLMDGFDDEPVDTSTRSTASQRPDSRENFLKPEEESEFAETLIEVAMQHESAGFHIHASGMPVVNFKLAIDLGMSMVKDMAIGMLVIILLLGILFQRASGVIMPLLVVVLSLLTTLALMPLFGVPFMGSTQILPTFLLAVGIADSLHILSIFYRRYDDGYDKNESIVYAMKQTAVAVLMTTATTAAGLLSFAFADLRPTQMLGIFGSIGVILALIYTIALIPALLAILPIAQKSNSETLNRTGKKITLWLDNCIVALGNIGVNHARKVVNISLLAAVLSGVGLFKLTMSHDPIRWYPEGHPVRVATETLDEKLSGSMTLEVVLDSGKENGLYDPAVLKLLEDIEQKAYQTHYKNLHILNTNSILNVIKENHKVLNSDNPAFYRIPDNREMIAQELLLFENSGSDDLEEVTDSNFRTARLTLMLPWNEVLNFGGFIQSLRNAFDASLQESQLENVSYKMVGLLVIAAKTLVVMLNSTIESYMIAFTLVGILMFLLMGGIKKGLLAFAPNIVPILFTLGMMGWFGIPLNLLTTMLGCIIIGISVDDTIHFMHHFQNYILTDNSSKKAIEHTLRMSGRAIAFTSIVLVGCFLVYTLDTFLTSIQFGILLSFAITVALFSNLLLSPALLTLFWKYTK
ncbi:MAG: MMPL family transporter [Pseudomonadales bacterium]|nr:MMPL family transporter [Pseudomonadales bacterium]